MDRLIVFGLQFLGGFWRNPPVVVVLVLNLIPALCVLWLGWSALALLLLYWLENVVIGAVNALKMAAAARGKPNGPVLAAAVIPFFVIHYGMFCLGHLVFTVLIGGGAFNGQDPLKEALALWRDRDGLLWAAAAMAALHLANYVVWLRQGGWRETDPQSQMGEPYGRIVVLHITILGGAFLLSETGAPAALIALLAVLKSIYDVATTAGQQRKLKAAQAAAAAG